MFSSFVLLGWALGHVMLFFLNFYLHIQVEKLIKELPSAPSDSSNAEVQSIDAQNVEAGTGVRETQSILLERIASEMNRLKFYISHAQVCLSIHSWSLGSLDLKVLFFVASVVETWENGAHRKMNMALTYHMLGFPVSSLNWHTIIIFLFLQLLCYNLVLSFYNLGFTPVYCHFCL